MTRLRRPYHNCSAHERSCPIHDHPENPDLCNCVPEHLGCDDKCPRHSDIRDLANAIIENSRKGFSRGGTVPPGFQKPVRLARRVLEILDGAVQWAGPNYHERDMSKWVADGVYTPPTTTDCPPHQIDYTNPPRPGRQLLTCSKCSATFERLTG